MWVFNGEEWTEDIGETKSPVRPEPPAPRYDELMPELQIVEVEIVRPTKKPPMPPFPLL